MYSLGIRGVGKNTAKLLSATYGDLTDIRCAGIESLTKIPDVGEITAERIINFFTDDLNSTVIDRILEAGVHWDSPSQLVGMGPLDGQTWVITGSFEDATREQIKGCLEMLGAKVSDSLSGKTTHLVAGANAGSEVAKVQALETVVLSGSNFTNLMLMFSGLEVSFF